MVNLYSVDELECDLSSATTQIAISKEMYTTALQSRPITNSTQLASKVLHREGREL